MLNFFKNHWFGLIVTTLALLYAAVVLIVVSSPREDALNRGFIPCTQQTMENMLNCEDEKRFVCIGRTIVQNTKCDIGVIIDGAVDWVEGKQPQPWSNYFFEPEVNYVSQQEDADEALLEFYRENPNVKEQMQKLNEERQKLDKLLQENSDEPELPK